MLEFPSLQFALNQKTAPHLPFGEFLDLAVQLGCIGVEPRTDLGRPGFDGMPPATAGRMARARGLRLLGISEIYPFDDWSEARRGQVAELIRVAQECGAESISLVPRVDGGGPVGRQREDHHRAILLEILSPLADSRLKALVEPIGFPGSSIRKQGDIVDVIASLNADNALGIVHGTFQHTLAADDSYAITHIGLVHISGLPVGREALTYALDRERGLVDNRDRSSAISQIRELQARGYKGAYSLECTSPSIQLLTSRREAIASSISYIRDHLSATLA